MGYNKSGAGYLDGCKESRQSPRCDSPRLYDHHAMLAVELNVSINVAPGLCASVTGLILNGLQRFAQDRSDLVGRHADARLAWVDRFDGRCNIDGRLRLCLARNERR